MTRNPQPAEIFLTGVSALSIHSTKQNKTARVAAKENKAGRGRTVMRRYSVLSSSATFKKMKPVWIFEDTLDYSLISL